ncbi:DUF4407 domain-containing protein [Actinoplanes bogorensis]|uniref:DUF4407 domain-containing protein n=1 Tax=Paractinoplanes bogorensis TaxID=1610840 RepID=A0ABS5YUD0_9ACTN|nr:DUF4407 domain-containing protein [Actinoplanes bogorensis]MBU2667064.1 DUF4407 domain-containing protein [Actinoplanes bogorensis]
MRYAQITGEPAPRPVPGPLNVGRLLRRCSGVNEGLLAWVPTERPRFTHLGGFVLFTALMAVGSSTVALMIAFDQPWTHVLPAAVFWGILIFNLDRWITATPLPDRGFRRIAVFLPRLLMAVVFAVVIAEPVLLVVFKTAVSEQLGKIRDAEVDAYKSRLVACNVVSATVPRRDDCRDVILSPSNTVQVAQERKAEAEKAARASKLLLDEATRTMLPARANMIGECRGLNGSPHGAGKVCAEMKGIYQPAQQRVDQAAEDYQAKRTQLAAAADSLENAGKQASSLRAAEIDRKTEEFKAHIDAKGGLLERIDALNRVADEHLSLLVAVWAVRLLLIAVDSIPAIGKLSSGKTTYDELARAEAALGQAQHTAITHVGRYRALHWVDQSAEPARFETAALRHEQYENAGARIDAAGRRRELPPARIVESVRPPRVEARMGQGPLDPDGGATPSSRTGKGLSSISVVALGGPGSGKTTFLAQMYAVLRRGRPFMLTVSDNAQRSQLESWARTISAPGSDWPDSTQTTHLQRYAFVGHVEHDGRTRPVLGIDYWDYSGEALLDDIALPGIDSLRRELSEKIMAADALLVIVDGENLYRAWGGEHGEMRRLLRPLSKIEAYAERTDCPIQIVVTKWDELANRPHPQGGRWNRAKVIAALHSLEPVRAMARGRQFRGGMAYGEEGVRIIPVSAVGGAGSTTRGSDRVTRTHSALPVNVDVPLAGLLPDRLDQLFAHQSDAEIERELRRATKSRWSTAFKVLGFLLGLLPLGGTWGPMLAKIGETAFTTWLPALIADKSRLPSADQGKYQQMLDDAPDHTSAAEQARDAAMEAFSSRLIQFDGEYPPTDGGRHAS